MGDKSGLCLWCGRYTTARDAHGMACCTRPDCIERRVHDDECDCPDCTQYTREGSQVTVRMPKPPPTPNPTEPNRTGEQHG